jgi:hypothetical protein
MKGKVRLGCYKLALAIKKRNPDLLQDLDTIAKDLATFCDGMELRLDVLDLAFEMSDRRAPFEEIMESAQVYLKFAEGKPPIPERPQKTLDPQKKKSNRYRKKTPRSR